MMGMGLGFGMFGLLFMVLFWGGLIALAIWLVSVLFPISSRRRTTPGADQPQSPREILDTRYARGEISREEYELMKQDLS
jgi:putative membrane protein